MRDEERGTEMREAMRESRGEVVEMKRAAAGEGMREVREATNGRVVTMLPLVWAVAEARGLQGVSDMEGGDRGKASATQPGRPSGNRAASAQMADVEVAFYRKYTEALLRRYQRLRMQSGRVPSPMDKEIFRGRMSHYKVQGFDDAVIFCVDVERCLARLNAADQGLVRRIAVQEYALGEAASLLGMSLRSCIVLYRRALDRTTRLFLEARLLQPETQVSCQEPAKRASEVSG